MNRSLITLGIACVLAGTASAESFDIASFSPPSGWSPEATKSSRVFTRIDSGAGTFCRITLHASMATLGSPKLDFDADWRDLIATPFKPTTAPTVESRVKAPGWQLTAGAAPAVWSKREAITALFMMTSATQRFAVSYVATGDCIAQMAPFIDALQLASVAAPAATSSTNPSDATATATTGGWSVTSQPDFVEARRDKLVVRLHFATAIPDALRGDPDAKRDHFWSTFVAPRYADIKNVRKPRIEAYATSEMLEADASELATRQRVHVAFHLFTANGTVSGVEVVAPSKDLLDVACGDATKVSALRDLNRFAISAKEVTGKWRDSSGSFAEYYNVYTGNSAGLAIGASTFKVELTAKGTFASEVKAVAGRTGSLSFGKENRAGTWRVVDGTLVTTSGAVSRSYTGWFEAVRGGRVLHLVDQQKSGMHDVLIRQP